MYNLYKKYQETKYLFEFILNNYLVTIGFRKLFQIQYDESSPYIMKFNSFLIENNISHKKLIQTDNEKCTKFIIYNKDVDINKIQKLDGKEFAQMLGEFYIFANENYYEIVHDTNSRRISINVSNKYNTCELYAQWGNLFEINTNMDFFVGYAKEIERLLHKIDPQLKVFVTL